MLALLLFLYKLTEPFKDFVESAPPQKISNFSSELKENKKTFFEKLVNKFLLIFLSNENTQFICHSFFKKSDDKTLQEDLYFASLNKEIAVFSLKPLIIKGDNYAICGDIIDFKLHLIKGKSLPNLDDSSETLLSDKIDPVFLEILNARKEGSSYQIELYDFNSRENYSYLLEVNKIKSVAPKNNLGSFFNPKIEKIGTGKKLYCSKNSKINISYQKYFGDDYKNLGNFSLDLNDPDIDREFRKIVAAQRQNSEISLVCDDVFLKSLTKSSNNLPKILIVMIKIF